MMLLKKHCFAKELKYVQATDLLQRSTWKTQLYICTN